MIQKSKHELEALSVGDLILNVTIRPRSFFVCLSMNSTIAAPSRVEASECSSIRRIVEMHNGRPRLGSETDNLGRLIVSSISWRDALLLAAFVDVQRSTGAARGSDSGDIPFWLSLGHLTPNKRVRTAVPGRIYLQGLKISMAKSASG